MLSVLNVDCGTVETEPRVVPGSRRTTVVATLAVTAVDGCASRQSALVLGGREWLGMPMEAAVHIQAVLLLNLPDELREILVLLDIEDLADEREPVGVQARRGQGDQDVARPDSAAVQHLGALGHPHGEARQVVFVRSVKARHPSLKVPFVSLWQGDIHRFIREVI